VCVMWREEEKEREEGRGSWERQELVRETRGEEERKERSEKIKLTSKNKRQVCVNSVQQNIKCEN
jgi:chromatin segregation and condensation protein Rec8/ScpA/Scc1 (kleisin family)